MDKRIEELIQHTKEKYGLHEYYLHSCDIYRSKDIFKNTFYTLSMEWFPNHIQNWDDEIYNPEGTACIDIDIHSRKIKSITFSGGKSKVDGIAFDLNNRDELINWIEKETDLHYGRQFVFWKEEDGELYFKECIDGVAVSPSGSIHVKLDEKGRLTSFSVYGQFPSNQLIKHEEYSLSFEQVKNVAKEQLKFIKMPVFEQKKIIPVFAIEEIYIKNKDYATLPYEFFVDDHFSLKMDKVIEWDHPLQNQTFQRKIISLDEKITSDQAFQCEGHPDLRPITEEEVEKCFKHIKDLLSQEYANDSGKWMLKSLYRDKGYIHATLKAKEQNECVYNRKMMLFIDAKTYEVLNYMDNKLLLEEMYKEMKEAEEVNITQDEAFEKLKNFIELTPYYVYDFEKGHYVLCGKLDCEYAVKANNGQVVELKDL